MGYSLEAEETLPEGLKRIAREELDAALAHLRDESGEPEDERVHEARKSFKKVRAILRFVRKEIGSDVYDAENTCLRDAGRRLAPVRDAQVLVDTLERLIEEAGASVSKRDLSRALRALRSRQQRTRERVLGDGEAFAEVAETIEAARGRIDGWPIGRVDSKAFRSSVAKTYGRGLDRFDDAYEEGTVEAFHEWRKRVKYHWYHLRLLEPAAPDEIGALEDRADQLSDVLGLDHDYAVLIEAIEELGTDAAPAEGRRRMIRWLERKRIRLERDAFPLGQLVFNEKPKGRAGRLASYFDGWRQQLGRERLLWLGEPDLERARELLRRKNDGSSAEARKARAELRDMGLALSELEELVIRNGDPFGPAHLDELVGRGLIGAGPATELDESVHVDRLYETDLDVGVNEGSGLCPITDRDFLEARGWELGFWVALDDTTVEEGTVAVGHRRGEGTGVEWRSEKIDFALPEEVPFTDDSEDCLLHDGYVYVFGSHYGSKEGPLELERQFVARFRESEAGSAERPAMEIAMTDFRLHRLLNDAIRDSEVEPMRWDDDVVDAIVGGAIAESGEQGADWVSHIEPDDQPINIEGCAMREGGGVLVGLRVPVSVEGHPIIVELAELDCLFGEPMRMPEVRGVFVVEGIGHPAAPAGVRGMAERPGGGYDLLTGNLDSTDKGSILIEHHPEAALARSAHFLVEIGERRRQGSLGSELVREFAGMMRVEGIAYDPLGRPFFAIDDDERVHLLYDEVGMGS